MGLLSGYRTEIQEKLIGANAEVVVFPLQLPSGGYPQTLVVFRGALYVGGMGARGSNFYNDLFARYGYEAEAELSGIVDGTIRVKPLCTDRLEVRYKLEG